MDGLLILSFNFLSLFLKVVFTPTSPQNMSFVLNFFIVSYLEQACKNHWKGG